MSDQPKTSADIKVDIRKLVYRFLELPWVHKITIAQKLGLLAEGNQGLKDNELTNSILLKAKEQDKYLELWEAVNEKLEMNAKPTTAELLSCPFCEISQIELLDPIDIGRSMRWQVACGRCGTHTGMSRSRESAIEHWNTRSDLKDKMVLSESELRGLLEMAQHTDNCGDPHYTIEELLDIARGKK